jgi:hypothetical protein
MHNNHNDIIFALNCSVLLRFREGLARKKEARGEKERKPIGIHKMAVRVILCGTLKKSSPLAAVAVERESSAAFEKASCGSWVFGFLTPTPNQTQP